jgi:hypothetical protein
MSGRPSAWRAVLETQWKWTRGLAFLGVVIGFSLPLLSLRTAASARTPGGFVLTMQAWGVAYAIVAGALGLMTAIVAWGYDHRLRHVYALSLPIARWRYVLMRFGSGLATLALPVLAVLIGAEIVAHNSTVPPTLHAYPVALTLRFGFATLVAYSLFFAISSATGRTAAYILGAIVLIVVSQVVLSSASVKVDLVSRAMDIVFAAPGLLAVFGGRWMLVDV